MESLAVVILGIILGIGVVVFVPLLLLWRKFLHTKFPKIHKAWWLLWVPLLLVASFYVAVLVLQLILLIGG